MEQTSLRGKLLVAAPGLREPTFARAVVTMLEHGPDGAVGVVINRPGDASLDEVVPTVADLASDPAVLFSGGPVQPSAAIALGVVTATAVATERDAGWRAVVPPLVTVDLDMDPSALAAALRALRVFAGYAGWGPGQLEAEIAQGAWYVVDSMLDDPFGPDPRRLWATVLRRQPWPLSAVSTCPLDPTMN
jgi:putative transcriptional regulator